MEEQEYETVDLLEVINVLWQNVRAILLCTVVGAAVAFVVSAFFIAPKYEASALMIVNTRQDATANVTSDQINSATKLVSTYGIIIKSDTVLQQVINNLDANTSYEEVERCVTVNAVENTQVMQVTVRSKNADWAKQVCKQITQIAPDVIVETVEAGSVKVISQAKGDPNPVSPNVQRNTVMGGLLGLVLCAGVVLVRFLLDNKVRTEEDVTRHLDLAVLGVIPVYENGGKHNA